MQLDNSVALLYNSNMATKEPPLKNNLAKLREKADITQADLARAIGVQQHSISNMENGVHGISDFRKAAICHALGCTYDDLLNTDTPC